MSAPKVFAREATGLVRSFSWYDAFLISFAVVNSGILSYSLALIVPLGSSYPGADMVNSLHIGLLFSIPLAITYSLLAMSMPRSGGDYVWISRSISPIIGFMAGWAFWLSALLLTGTGMYVTPTVLLPVFFASFGYATGNSSLLSLATAVTTPSNVLIVGTVVGILATAIGSLGVRTFRYITSVLMILMFASTAVCVGVFAASTHLDFVNALNGYGGTNMTYAGILSSAKSAGWNFVPNSMSVTLLSVPYAVLVFLGFNYSAAAAGEVKRIRSSISIAIIGSLIVGWVVNAVAAFATVNTLGYPFIQAVYFSGTAWPLVAPPWPPMLASVLIGNNIPLLVVLQVGWAISFLFSCVGYLLVATRYVFAFSFDRVFPVKLADINDRFHFPIKASALNFVISMTFLVITVYTSWLTSLLNSTAIVALVWAIGSVPAILLPYKNKEIVASLPGAKWKVPFIAIIGAASAVLNFVVFYFALAIPGVGPSTPQSDAVLAGVFVSGPVFYAIRYRYLRGKGIDLKLAFAQLPPE